MWLSTNELPIDQSKVIISQEGMDVPVINIKEDKSDKIEVNLVPKIQGITSGFNGKDF